MSGWDDDDDWVGEPPEGRYTRDRADPGFWRRNRMPVSITAAGIGVVVIVLVLIRLL